MKIRKRRSDRSGRAPLSSPGRPSVAGRDERRRFWAAIAVGLESEDAALVDQIKHLNPRRDSHRIGRMRVWRMRTGICITLKPVTAAVWQRSRGIATPHISMSGGPRSSC